MHRLGERGHFLAQVKLCRFARLKLLGCELNNKGLRRICESDWLLGVQNMRKLMVVGCAIASRDADVPFKRSKNDLMMLEMACRNGE